MSKSQQFQPLQYALLIHDVTGAKIGGTGSQHDLDGTRRLAESILRTVRQAVTVQVHPWIGDTYVPSCVEVVCRSVSEASEIAPVADPADVVADDDSAAVTPEDLSEEATPDVPVVESLVELESPTEPSVEPIPIRRKRERPPTVRQEAVQA